MLKLSLRRILDLCRDEDQASGSCGKYDFKNLRSPRQRRQDQSDASLCDRFCFSRRRPGLCVIWSEYPPTPCTGGRGSVVCLAEVWPGGITEQENWKYLKICLSSLLRGIMKGKENPRLDEALEKPV